LSRQIVDRKETLGLAAATEAQTDGQLVPTDGDATQHQGDLEQGHCRPPAILREEFDGRDCQVGSPDRPGKQVKVVDYLV